MIHEKALALAGDNAHLVARPRGVLHVYTGRLTPRAHVPRAARPMCRARTRQLAVVQVCSSLAAVGTSSTARRLCARCTACLTRDSRQTVHQLRTRLEYQAAHRRTTAHDVVFALRAAETPDEVDAAAHLTLVLFDYRATTVPNPATGRSLLDEVQAARTRVHGWPESVYATAQRFNDLSMAATETRKARAKQLREERTATWEANRPVMPHHTDTTHEGATPS